MNNFIEKNYQIRDVRFMYLSHYQACRFEIVFDNFILEMNFKEMKEFCKRIKDLVDVNDVDNINVCKELTNKYVRVVFSDDNVIGLKHIINDTYIDVDFNKKSEE